MLKEKDIWKSAYLLYAYMQGKQGNKISLETHAEEVAVIGCGFVEAIANGNSEFFADFCRELDEDHGKEEDEERAEYILQLKETVETLKEEAEQTKYDGFVGELLTKRFAQMASC